MAKGSGKFEGGWDAADVDPMADHEARYQNNSPMKRLGMAIIEQAVNDLRVISSGKESYRLKGEAIGLNKKTFALELEEDIAGPWFTFWCDHINVDSDFIREKMMSIRNGRVDTLSPSYRRPRRVSSRSKSPATETRAGNAPPRAYIRRLGS